MGPVSLNVYINDLQSVPNYCFLESYVDDSKLRISMTHLRKSLHVTAKTAS